MLLESAPGPGGQQLERDRRTAGEQRDPPPAITGKMVRCNSSTRSWTSRPFQSCRLSWITMGRPTRPCRRDAPRSEEHTSELQSHHDLVCRLLLEKKKKK